VKHGLDLLHGDIGNDMLQVRQDVAHEAAVHDAVDDHGVDLAALQDHFGDRRRQQLHVQVKGHVHGIRAGGTREDMAADLLLEPFRIAGNCHAACIGRMGDGRARSAGIRHDAEPAAAQRRLRSERPAVAVELLEGLHPENPRLPENAFIQGIRAGHRTGVALACPCAGG